MGLFCIAIVGRKAIASIRGRAGIKTPGRGICFTVPSNKTLGINMYMSEGKGKL